MGNRWDRLPGESDKAFAAFCAYRDMGAERSIEKAFRQYQNTTKTVPTYWKEWSAKFQWVDRTKAYDSHLDELKLEAIAELQLKLQSEIIQNEIDDYKSMRKAIHKRIQVYQGLDWKADPNELKDLLEIMRRNDDMGRRAAGMPDKITKNDNHHSGVIDWRQAVIDAMESNEETE